MWFLWRQTAERGPLLAGRSRPRHCRCTACGSSRTRACCCPPRRPGACRARTSRASSCDCARDIEVELLRLRSWRCGQAHAAALVALWASSCSRVRNIESKLLCPRALAAKSAPAAVLCLQRCMWLGGHGRQTPLLPQHTHTHTTPGTHTL